MIIIGDIVGKAGKRAIEELLTTVKQKYRPQLTIANAENITNGRGITQTDYKWLLNQGVDVITLGNHAFDHHDIHNFIHDAKVLVRPWNMAEEQAGKGVHFVKINQTEIAVINLLGKSFMKNCLDPFLFLEEHLPAVYQRTPHIIVDFHAESTSEKQAMGYFLDGRALLVYGTHTHIQTNDGRILPKGTGYITDIGMTGAYESVIGFKIEDVIQKFKEASSKRLRVEEDGKIALSGIYFEWDPSSNRGQTLLPINVEF